MREKEFGKARLALAAVCFFWGTTYLAIRVAVSELPTFLFCAVRFTLAGGAMLGYAHWRGQSPPRGRDWLDLAVVGILLLTVGNGILAWAMHWVPTGVASLIIVTTPLWMAAFASAAGEAVRGRAVIGLLLGFAGLGTLIWPQVANAEPGSGFMSGALGLLFSCATWALGSVYSKRRPPRTQPVMTVAVEMLISGAVFLALGLLNGDPARWHATWRGWTAIVYLAVFGSIVGYGSYIYALSKLPTPQVAIYAYVNPIIAVLLGAAFLGESIDASMMLGAPLVLSGIYLVNSSRLLPGPEAPATRAGRWFRGFPWRSRGANAPSAP